VGEEECRTQLIIAAAIPSKASTSTRPGASAGISHQHQHISEWHGMAWHGMAGNESIKQQAAAAAAAGDVRQGSQREKLR
jgi:hypothetical protein